MLQDQRAAGLPNSAQSEAQGAHLDAAKHAQAVFTVSPRPLPSFTQAQLYCPVSRPSPAGECHTLVTYGQFQGRLPKSDA